MNSYELDQPLDLRLKALNLSRATFHDVQHHYHPAHNLVMVNNLMLSPYGPNANSCTNYYGIQPARPLEVTHQLASRNEAPTQQSATNINSILNPSPQFCHQHRPNYSLGDPRPFEMSSLSEAGQPLVSHQRCANEPESQAVQGQQKQQQEPHPQTQSQHNVHCQQQQQLGQHHQHQNTMSKVHSSSLVSQSHSPLGLPLASAPSSASLPICELNSSSSSSSDMLSNMSPLCHSNHHHRAGQVPIAGSLQNLAHQNCALKHRQLSPPLHFHNHNHQHHLHHNLSHSQQQHQQQQLYQPILPVRSLSMSGQMMTPSHLSLMVSPPTSTPPTSAVTPSTPAPGSALSQYRLSFSGQSPAAGSGSICDTNTTSNSTGATCGVSSPSRGNSGCFSESNNTRLSSPMAAEQQSSAPIPTSNGSQEQQQRNCDQSPSGSPGGHETTSSNGANSPIMRQHSLVSRYNCKPCGIVFSQPETLRAHQEGYCTKTNRAQLRSQSAVSPSAIQQAANPNNKTSNCK